MSPGALSVCRSVLYAPDQILYCWRQRAVLYSSVSVVCFRLALSLDTLKSHSVCCTVCTRRPALGIVWAQLRVDATWK